MWWSSQSTHGLILELNRLRVLCPGLNEQADKLYLLLLFLMGDFKLDLFLYLTLYYELKWFLVQLINMWDPFFHTGLFFPNTLNTAQFAQNLTTFFGLKFAISVGFLIVIRGGTPRYRYDYLTKLGWLKFIGLVISVFLSSLAFFFIF